MGLYNFDFDIASLVIYLAILVAYIPRKHVDRRQQTIFQLLYIFGLSVPIFDILDVILINNNLKSILTLFNLSFNTIKNIKQNLFWAFFYNLLMIPIAMGLFSKIGLKLNPMLASLAMVLSSFSVIINALRLKNVNK